jgi:hypothetical protein
MKTFSKQKIISDMSTALRLTLLAGFGLAVLFGLVQFVLVFNSYGFASSLIAGLVLFAAILAFSILLTLILAALKKLRWQTSLVFFVSMFLCLLSLALGIFLIPLLICFMSAIYLSIMCAKGQYQSLKTWKRILRYVLLAMFSIFSVLILMLILLPGPSLENRPKYASLALPFAENVKHENTALQNPAENGTFNYTIHYYATAGQKINPYPEQEIFFSRTADVSELLDGWSSIRRSQLGFESDALPLNGKIWMPIGDGTFPLTLIVHGNHESGDRSDGGYDYLGELLASRGIIAVSVDENFFNSSSLYDALFFARLKGENDARAFVLLEHLRQWHDWNADASSLFFNKVDFENIALIGHSRGGEAVALAAAFAELKVYPDNGKIFFDYPFKIKSVAAIAPTHGQYNPAGLETKLNSVNYLVLHGGHDMDVSSFSGADMYRGVDVFGGGVKAAVWMQHANHGQFNSTWGANDTPGLMNLSFNRKLLMPMNEQQQAAKVFISAFLESTLHEKEEYNSLFKNFSQGKEWLPPALYVTDYSGNETMLLDSFDSGFDITVNNTKQIIYTAQGFDTWTQTNLPGKWGNNNRVLMLKWGSKEHSEKNIDQLPIFSIDFSNGTITTGDTIYMSLCSGNENADTPNVSFNIRLTDNSGMISEMSINEFGGVTNPIDAPIGKPIASSIIGKREPVLQMICIPTERFDNLSSDIISMEWIIDNTEISNAEQILYADDLRVEKKYIDNGF